MSRKLWIVAIVLLTGIRTEAVAQAQRLSHVQIFTADWNRRALSETHNPYLTGTPVLSEKPDDPVGDESFADRFATMQARSSSDDFSGVLAAHAPASARSADPAGGQSFAQRFAEMQAASSNSGRFTAAATNKLRGRT